MLFQKIPCLFIYLRTFNCLKSFPVPAKAGCLGQSDKKWHGPYSTEIVFLEYKWTRTMVGVKLDLLLMVLALWCITHYIVSCTGSLKERRIAPVIMILLYESGQFWVWTWVERRVRANFRPPLQVTCLRKQEILGTTRTGMQGTQNTEAGLGFFFLSCLIYLDKTCRTPTNEFQQEKGYWPFRYALYHR